MGAGNVTASMMAQLTEQHKALLAAATKKSFNLLSIFETIAAVADDSSSHKKAMAALENLFDYYTQLGILN